MVMSENAFRFSNKLKLRLLELRHCCQLSSAKISFCTTVSLDSIVSQIACGSAMVSACTWSNSLSCCHISCSAVWRIRRYMGSTWPPSGSLHASSLSSVNYVIQVSCQAAYVKMQLFSCFASVQGDRGCLGCQLPLGREFLFPWNPSSVQPLL